MKGAPNLLTNILPRHRLPRWRLPRRLHADRAWATARALVDGVDGRAFRELVQTIDGSVWHPLGTVELFDDGAATFAAIRQAIDGAREEVLLEMYIVRDDVVGRALQSTLVAAARRGVQVCVLADSIGSLRTPRAFWDTLAQAGIAVRRYGAYGRSPFHAWRRDHRKIIVVDRTTAFTGGMNVGDEYGSRIARGAGRTHRPVMAFRDVFVRVEGAVVLELAAVFAEGWTRARGAPLHHWPAPASATMPPASATLPPAAATMSPAEPPAIRLSPAVLVLDAGPGRGQRESVAVLAALVGATRTRLWITTPYFVPPNAGLRLLEDAAARGVDVRLLLPSRYDVPVVRHAARAVYSRLLRAGVRIFEYERAMLHAKTVVGDNALCMVGSANLDFRSLFINAECNLMIADSETVEQLAARFLHDLEGAREVVASTWARRPYPQRVLECAARSMRSLL